MDTCTPKIVVAGDVCIDWLRWRAAASDEGLNWQLYDGAAWAALPGGALLLAQMLRRAGGATVLAPQLDDLRTVPPDRIIHSLAELDLFPLQAKGGKFTYRIARFLGYTGPPPSQAPGLLPVAGDDPAADLVVLDDAGNSFRSSPDFWPAALTTEGARPLVVYKMAQPLLAGPLWDREQRTDPDRLVVIINADHLRAQGVDISRRLSWERTAKDFVWQMACNPALSALANARHLVLRLGLEGAVYYSSTPQGIVSRLYFDPSQVEGGYAARYPGGMQGLGDAFAAGLAQALVCPAPSATADETPARVAAGIRAGLRAARRLLQGGFGQAAGISAFPTPAVFAQGEEPEAAPLAEVVVPNPVATEPPDPAYWCILKDMPGTVLEDLAHDLVRHGLTEGLLSVPVGEFGKLRTADRVEIEGLRSLRNLIDEYLNGTPARPLSVAVFGAPGSGKSFAVTQVAESIGGSQRVERVEFNVSQFRSPDDLVQAFHRVRDIALTGAVPLVFFDEFDSGYESELGWLKYFLAPMQDGVFRDGEAVHPIGKAIFVFAGGTHSSFREFAEPELECGPEASSAAREAALRRFKAVKGPDFVSRLRGFVDILGPNPVAESDTTAVVRRAMLLRSLIERKARRLLDSHGGARIDEGVLRALLRVPAYRHGARSMEALLDMSMLAGRSCWEQAALPPAIQLALHVDSDIFTRLMLRDVLLTAARDVLGQAVHENYRHNQEGKKSPDDPSMQPWEKLREDFRESNRQQADHIAAKLRRIGCGPRPISGCEPAPFTFTEKEVEIMAEMEHERWVVERRIADWVYGPKRDPDHKVSPYLVPYSKLPDDVKGWDRDAVRAIPKILALARFEVYRLQ